MLVKRQELTVQDKDDIAEQKKRDKDDTSFTESYQIYVKRTQEKNAVIDEKSEVENSQ